MLEKTGRKAMDALEGLRGSLDGVRDGGARLAGRMGMRLPGRSSWTDRIPGTGWSIAITAASALAAAALWLYLRKRRQVTDHYTMDEGLGGWEGGRVHSFETTDSFRT